MNASCLGIPGPFSATADGADLRLNGVETRSGRHLGQDGYTPVRCRCREAASDVCRACHVTWRWKSSTDLDDGNRMRDSHLPLCGEAGAAGTTPIRLRRIDAAVPLGLARAHRPSVTRFATPASLGLSAQPLEADAPSRPHGPTKRNRNLPGFGAFDCMTPERGLVGRTETSGRSERGMPARSIPVSSWPRRST